MAALGQLQAETPKACLVRPHREGLFKAAGLRGATKPEGPLETTGPTLY